IKAFLAYLRLTSERVADERQHMAAEQDRRPDEDGGRRGKLRRERRVLARSDGPRLVHEHEIGDVQAAEQHEDDLPEKRHVVNVRGMTRANRIPAPMSRIRHVRGAAEMPYPRCTIWQALKA